jgi:DNA-binding SARP family transcriptional activator
VDVDGRPLDLGTVKQRVVLVALLVDRGCPVSLDQLVDRVWGDEPPPQARGTLYAHLSRIRRLLAQVEDDPGDRPVLERRSGGYALRLDPDRVDLHRFDRLVAQSRAGEPDDPRCVAPLREAMALCQREPLVGLPGRWIEHVRRHLDERRLAVVLRWAGLELELDRPDLVVGPLTALALERPLVEPAVVILMRALRALGRRAEALEWYDRVSCHLVAELGVTPGNELRAMRHALLR